MPTVLWQELLAFFCPVQKTCDIPFSFVPGWLLKSRVTSQIMLAAADYTIKFGKITCADPRDTLSKVFSNTFVARLCVFLLSCEPVVAPTQSLV